MNRDSIVIDAGPPRVSRLAVFPCVGLVVSGACMLVASFYVVSRLIESPPRPLPRDEVVLGAMLGAGTLVLFAVTALVAFARDRHRALATSGRVEIRESTMFITKADQRLGVKWADVTGYSDASPEFVQILTMGTVYPKHLLTIPTPQETDRVTILALLDRRGVPRVDD